MYQETSLGDQNLFGEFGAGRCKPLQEKNLQGQSLGRHEEVPHRRNPHRKVSAHGGHVNIGALGDGRPTPSTGKGRAHDKAAANIAMVGIIYLNGFAGRSGEWQKMKRAYVQDQLNMNCASLTCKEHKTSNEYGELCKWISRGTAEAMKTFLMLPGKTSDLFLEPVRASTSHTAVHSCLKRFGEIYWPTHQAPACNLVRKLFHARLKKMSHKNKVWNLISKVDAHSEEVASKIYAVSTAEDDVELGKFCSKPCSVIPYHAWPTEAEEAHAGGGHEERVSSVAAIVAVEPDPIDSEDEDLHAYAIDEACGTVHPKRDPNSFHTVSVSFFIVTVQRKRDPNSVDLFSVPKSNELAQPKPDPSSVDHSFSVEFHHSGAAKTRPQQCRPPYRFGFFAMVHPRRNPNTFENLSVSNANTTVAMTRPDPCWCRSRKKKKELTQGSVGTPMELAAAAMTLTWSRRTKTWSQKRRGPEH